MKVLIVGGGKTLYFLCRNFTAKGYEVVIINRNRGECVQLARQLSAMVVCGDGSDARILKEAGAMGADVVLAITPNDEDNLVICQLASIQFGVPRAIALANDPDNAEIFEKLGVVRLLHDPHCRQPDRTAGIPGTDHQSAAGRRRTGQCDGDRARRRFPGGGQAPEGCRSARERPGRGGDPR